TPPFFTNGMYALYSAALSLTASERMPWRALIALIEFSPWIAPGWPPPTPAAIQPRPDRHGWWCAADHGYGWRHRTRRPACSIGPDRSSRRPPFSAPDQRHGAGAGRRMHRRSSAGPARYFPAGRQAVVPSPRPPHGAGPCPRPATSCAPARDARVPPPAPRAPRRRCSLVLAATPTPPHGAAGGIPAAGSDCGWSAAAVPGRH